MSPTEKKVRALRTLEKRRTELSNFSNALCGGMSAVRQLKEDVTPENLDQCLKTLGELNSKVEEALEVVRDRIIKQREAL